MGDSANPLFCASDVCKALEYKNGRVTIERLFGKGVTKCYTPTSGGNQELTYLTEPQLYKLILRSNAKNAEPFQDWVCEKVLPSIRKKGYYFHPQKLQRPLEIPETIPYREELKNLIDALSQEEGIYFNRLKEFSIKQVFDENRNEREISFKINAAEIVEKSIY